MDDNTGTYYILDGAVKDAANPEYIDNIKNSVVYEVIRVIHGVPLFIEDHLSRLEASINAIGGVLNITASELAVQLKSVIDVNSDRNCNVKVVVYEEDGRQKSLLYISKSYYPSDEETERGVPVGLLHIQRQDPNIKLFSRSYKESVNARILEGDLFEVLLVNNEGIITEGSKSNVFFVKRNKIYTTPGAYILKGITRKYVLEACGMAGYEVTEALTDVKGLWEAEGVFLSGTSIKVLPVSSIDGKPIESGTHPVITAVREAYDRIVGKYIDRNVNIW